MQHTHMYTESAYWKKSQSNDTPLLRSISNIKSWVLNFIPHWKEPQLNWEMADVADFWSETGQTQDEPGKSCGRKQRGAQKQKGYLKMIMKDNMKGLPLATVGQCGHQRSMQQIITHRYKYLWVGYLWDSVCGLQIKALFFPPEKHQLVNVVETAELGNHHWQPSM